MKEHAPDWQDELEALVRGLAHAMSNRITAISALVELGDAATPDGAAELRNELRRLHEVNRLLKQLGGAEQPGAPEALEVAHVLREAVALHERRLDLRGVPCRVQVHPGVVPVRVRPRALLRVLLVLLAHVARRADGGGVDVVVAGDDRETTVTLTPAGAEGCDGSAIAPLTARLLAEAGGELVVRGGGLTLALPSLLEVRRRERGE